MKRFLMTMALFLILAPLAQAAEVPGEPATAPEATENEAGPAVAELAIEAEPARDVSVDQILGFSPLFSALSGNRVEKAEALCIVCPLTYCKRKNIRCDYVGCPRETCCSFTCYTDTSCTSGKCRSFDCGCRRIRPLPL